MRTVLIFRPLILLKFAWWTSGRGIRGGCLGQRPSCSRWGVASGTHGFDYVICHFAGVAAGLFGACSPVGAGTSAMFSFSSSLLPRSSGAYMADALVGSALK